MLAVQGLTAALAARWAGDPGPTHDGRATLNPLAHLDLLGLAALLLFRAGWVKPLDVDARRIGSRAGAVLALLAPTLALLAFGALGLALRPAALQLVGGSAGIALSTVMATTFQLAARSALLGLLPLPPLLGAYWLLAANPDASPFLSSARARLVGGLVVAVALFLGLLEPFLVGGTRFLLNVLGY